jgi:hypothetical protein
MNLFSRFFLILAVLWPLALSAQVSSNTGAALDALKSEPGVRDVQQAALRYFHVNQSQVESMRNRASSKAMAPVVEISAGLTDSDTDEDTLNYEFSNVAPWVQRYAGGRAWDVRAKLSWNLPRLVFNPEELDVASLAGLVEGILKESTRLYFMRRRLQVDMILNPPTDTATSLTKELRVQELTGLLDAMTGGWFRSTLDKLEAKRSVSSR